MLKGLFAGFVHEKDNSEIYSVIYYPFRNSFKIHFYKVVDLSKSRNPAWDLYIKSRLSFNKLSDALYYTNMALYISNYSLPPSARITDSNKKSYLYNLLLPIIYKNVFSLFALSECKNISFINKDIEINNALLRSGTEIPFKWDFLNSRTFYTKGALNKGHLKFLERLYPIHHKLNNGDNKFSIILTLSMCDYIKLVMKG